MANADSQCSGSAESVKQVTLLVVSRIWCRFPRWVPAECDIVTLRFRFRLFIHPVLRQGKCLESGKHTNISERQHWHTSTSTVRGMHPSAPPEQRTHAHTHTLQSMCCYVSWHWTKYTCSVQFSSVQESIYALGKPHMRSTPSLRSFPTFAFWNGSNVRSDWRWPSLVLLRKIVCLALHHSTPLSSRRSMVWCPWLCACR